MTDINTNAANVVDITELSDEALDALLTSVTGETAVVEGLKLHEVKAILKANKTEAPAYWLAGFEQ